MTAPHFDAVADLESGSYTQPVAVAVRTAERMRRWWFSSHADERRAVEWLLGFRGTCWWHSGGRYDLLWLLDWCLELGVVPSLKMGMGQRLIELRVGESVHRDSFALWPRSLADASKGLPGAKGSLELPCECGKGCGGYCAIHRGMPTAQRRQVITYLERDVEALWQYLTQRLTGWQRALGVSPRGTMGGSAWHTAREACALPDADPSRSRHLWTRPAYYTGRVEALRGAAVKVRHYDMRSAYAAQLARLDLPMGEPVRMGPIGAREALAAWRPGVYEVTVRSPEQWLPILPWRSPKGRVAYPVGELRGRWVLPELRYALESGYELMEVHAAQVYARTAQPCAEWVQRMWAHRLAEPGPREKYVKDLLAALTGAFGARPYVSRLLVAPKTVKACPCRGLYGAACPCKGRCCQGCHGDCGAYIRWSVDADVWLARTPMLTPRSHVIWAAHLTAAVRVELHRMAVVMGPDAGQDVACLDTDALVCEGARATDPDDRLGGWREVDGYDRVDVMSPRTWRGTRADGSQVIKAAGVPKANAPSLLRDGYAEVNKMVGLREGLEQGKTFAHRTQTRTIKTHKDSRGVVRMGWRVEDGHGRFRAPYTWEVDL